MQLFIRILNLLESLFGAALGEELLRLMLCAGLAAVALCLLLKLRGNLKR